MAVPCEKVECVVIGAGVIGLAVARHLAARGREVICLEREGAIGTGTSARNSEVIHAGLYYPENSLKAALCRSGRDLLYAYLDEYGLDYRKCGKLIVATHEDELEGLQNILARALANGVLDLELLDADTARAMEPDIRCLAALWSPSTGIVDSHGYMLSLQGQAENAGACFAFYSPVTGGELGADDIMLSVGGNHPMQLRARYVVNCTGLHADHVAAGLALPAKQDVPRLRYAKGNYFSLAGRQPFSRLVYPLPGAGGLGTHYTLDLAGRGRFGPDVEWVENIDYTVDPRRADAFYAAIRKYWPGLPDQALQPDYAGIRPKLHGPGQPPADFVIQGPQVHGIAGLVNLFGIESPGLTASLAIAGEVSKQLGITDG